MSADEVFRIMILSAIPLLIIEIFIGGQFYRGESAI